MSIDKGLWQIAKGPTGANYHWLSLVPQLPQKPTLHTQVPCRQWHSLCTGPTQNISKSPLKYLQYVTWWKFSVNAITLYCLDYDKEKFAHVQDRHNLFFSEYFWFVVGWSPWIQTADSVQLCVIFTIQLEIIVNCMLYRPSYIFNEQFKNNLVSVGIVSSYFVYLGTKQGLSRGGSSGVSSAD